MEQTSSIMALSWLVWKYIATSNSISPKEAETPAALYEKKRTKLKQGLYITNTLYIQKNKIIKADQLFRKYLVPIKLFRQMFYKAR